MAYRYDIPYLPMEEVGPEVDRRVPVFPAAPEIRFKMGADLTPFVQEMCVLGRVRINAAACAGKSTRMPIQAVRAGVSVLVHTIPNLNSAWTLYDYVSSVNKGDQITFISEFKAGEFPTGGLVITSSTIFALYATSWRARGEDPGVTLFLDESHETDAATTALRRLQNAVPGVRNYIEATATGGSDATEYRKVITPGGTRQYTYPRVAPKDWNMSQASVPWSTASTTGDFLIFNDDPVQRADIITKFNDVGVDVFPFDAHTPLEEFKSLWRMIAKRPRGSPVIALLADSNYRSCVTYPRVTRIIDTCVIRYMRPNAGKIIPAFRDAYASEVYQAAARGARVPGILCDYWRPEYGLENPPYRLEGLECDLAALFYRMLGFIPPDILKESLYKAGSLVPNNFTRLLASPTALRQYKSDVSWPGTVVKEVSPPVSPMTAPGSPDGEYAFVSREGYTSGAPTLETLSDSDEAEPVVSADSAAHKHGGSPDMTRLTTDWANKFNRAKSFVKRSPARMELGKYYDIRGMPLVAPTRFTGYNDLLTAMGGMSDVVFVRGLSPSLREEVANIALSTYNAAVAVMTAGVNVVTKVTEEPGIRDRFSSVVLDEWVTFVHGNCVRGESQAVVCMDLLQVLFPGACEEISPLVLQERRAIEKFLQELAKYTESVAPDRPGLCALDQVFDPGANSGRYRIDVKPDGLRSKLAMLILGNSDAQVNILMQN